MPGVEKEKYEESEKVVHALATVKVSHLSPFLALFLAMILPRVIRRVSYSCWCGLDGSVGLWLCGCGCAQCSSVAEGAEAAKILHCPSFASEATPVRSAFLPNLALDRRS